jgi:hypothetical protein
MCFSASASFGAAIILGAAGIAAVSKVKKKADLAFAAIPFIFGTQQFFEGMIWKQFESGPGNYDGIYGVLFLVIAQIVWPIWVPFSILLIEPNRQRKKILLLMIIPGLITAIYLGTCILTNQYIATHRQNHIHYDLPCYNNSNIIIGICYLLATVVPAFISSLRKMRALAALILLSVAFSELFFHDDLISVWCYFAAIISAFIFLIIRQKNLENAG